MGPFENSGGGDTMAKDSNTDRDSGAGIQEVAEIMAYGDEIEANIQKNLSKHTDCLERFSLMTFDDFLILATS